MKIGNQTFDLEYILVFLFILIILTYVFIYPSIFFTSKHGIDTGSTSYGFPLTSHVTGFSANFGGSENGDILFGNLFLDFGIMLIASFLLASLAYLIKSQTIRYVLIVAVIAIIVVPLYLQLMPKLR